VALSALDLRDASRINARPQKKQKKLTDRQGVFLWLARECTVRARNRRLITMGGEPIPIPDEQIESVQKLLTNNVPCRAHPFLKIGQRVRVRGGSLDGVEGILVRVNGEKGLVVSIDAISRSLALRIEGYDVEPASK
jgi:hypothetical protein